MTIHTVRIDIITAIEQHRHDIITIRIMSIAIDLAISSNLIAISRSDHLRRSVIMVMYHLIMCHPISIAHLLTESIDKKYNEIKKIIII